MKTNIVLESQSRNLFGQIVRQQTKEGMLNLSDLQEAYTIARVKNGWVEKNITMIMTNPANLETTFYLLEKQGAINISRLSFMENVANHGFAKYMKTLGVYKTTGARNTKTVWVNPYIWVMVAMELNPMIYAAVITWLTDTLIFDRIEAGDEFRPMNNAIKKIVPNPDYKKYAIAINERVFGKHLTGMRNLASAQELRKITKIEQFISQGINMNMIKDERQTMYAIGNFAL